MSILRHPQIDPYSTSSFLTTASVASSTITFTKGDGSTFPITVNTGSTVSINTSSLLTTASVSLNTITFTKGDGSTFPITVNTGSGGGGGGGGVVFKSTVAGTTVTGTTKTLPTYTLTIPANTFVKGNIIRIHYRAVKKLFDNSSTIKLNIGIDPDIDLSTNIANTLINAGFPFIQMKRDFIIPSDSKPTNFISPKFVGFSDNNQSDALEELSIDWSQTQYLFFAVQNSLASDDMTGVSYYIEKL